MNPSNDNNEHYLSMIHNFVYQKNDKGAELLSILRSYIRNQCFNKYGLLVEDQEEVLQEVAIKIMSNHKKIKTNAYGWVLRIAHNECINKLKKNKPFGRVMLMNSSNELVGVVDDMKDDSTLLGNTLDIMELIDCFDHIFDKIVAQSHVEQDREIYFKYILGLTNSEIAKQTGRNEGAIARRISVLKGRVKELFLKCC